MGSLANSHIGLLANFFFSAASGLLLLRASRTNSCVQVPQALLGVCAVLFAGTYLADILRSEIFATTVEIRRGISWVFWPCFTWATYCTMAHRRQVKRDAERFVKLIQERDS